MGKSKKCMDCGIGVYKTSKRCKLCYSIWREDPKNHPRYKDGKCIDPKCIDCGTNVHPQATRCRPCGSKHHSKVMLAKYKDNKKTKCIDCNVIISPNSKRCKSCHNKSVSTSYICIDCGVKISCGSKRCKSCNYKFSVGENAYNYIDGKYINQNYCVDCNTEVSITASRCKQCAGPIKSQLTSGKNSPNYKHGKSTNNKCVDCGVLMSAYPHIRCRKCYGLTISGEGHYLYGKQMPQVFRDKLSKAKKGKYLGKNNHRYGKPAPHGKRDAYNGVYMRSTWETKYAKYLDENNIDWKYEPRVFEVVYKYENKIKEGTYCPDFYLPETDEYIEIKGFWRDDAKAKYDAFKEQYKEITIKLLMKKELENMEVLK